MLTFGSKADVYGTMCSWRFGRRDMDRKPYVGVTAFIDWNSQLRRFSKRNSSDTIFAARSAFNFVARKIANGLETADPGARFKVSLRLYHGWHKGFQPSVNKVAISRIVAETDFEALSPRPNVVFSEVVAYGDCLVVALPQRLHPKLSIHLPNTLREREGESGIEEKMVDTALAADMIVTAYQDPDDWIMVASEDDDLVPPLFVVEAIKHGRSSRVLLMSQRKRSEKFVNLKGMEV